MPAQVEPRVQTPASVILVTPNPTLDLIYDGEDYRLPGKIFFRSFAMRPGGSGINVARGLRALNIPVLIFTILGGRTGKMVHGLLIAENLDTFVVPGAGETRTAAVQYLAGKKQMAVGKSPNFSLSTVRRFVDVLRPAARAASFLFFGGSFPADVAALRLMAGVLAESKARIFVDSRGAVLQELMELVPFCVKVDFERPAADGGPASQMLRKMQNQRTSLLCVETPEFICVQRGSSTLIRSPMGARDHRPYGRGDAFMAGLIFGYTKGFTVEEAARCGILAADCWGEPGDGLGSIDSETFFSRLSEHHSR